MRTGGVMKWLRLVVVAALPSACERSPMLTVGGSSSSLIVADPTTSLPAVRLVNEFNVTVKFSSISSSVSPSTSISMFFVDSPTAKFTVPVVTAV